MTWLIGGYIACGLTFTVWIAWTQGQLLVKDVLLALAMGPLCWVVWTLFNLGELDIWDKPVWKSQPDYQDG